MFNSLRDHASIAESRIVTIDLEQVMVKTTLTQSKSRDFYFSSSTAIKIFNFI